ncbi:MAG: MFS transporter, partial [Candidatus Humimicrobiaceae bacterium]
GDKVNLRAQLEKLRKEMPGVMSSFGKFSAEVLKDSALTKKTKELINYLKETPNFFSIFMFPLFMLSASPIVVDMSRELATPPEVLSFIFTFYTIGIVLGDMTSVLYNIKFKKIITVSAFHLMLAAVTLGLSFSRSLYVFYILYFISGYMVGIIFMQANEYLAMSRVKNITRLYTIAHTFFPIGGLVSPLISSNIVAAGFNWRIVYYVNAVFIIINLLLYLLLFRKRSSSNADKQEYWWLQFKRVFDVRGKNIILGILMFSILLYSISENSMSAWVPTFLRIERLFDVQEAGFAISIFWVTLIIGRIILSIFTDKIKIYYAMIFMAVFSIIFMVPMIFIPVKYLIYASTALVGMGYAGIFPLIIAQGVVISRKNSGVILSILVTTGAVGAIIGPTLTSLAAKASMLLSISVPLISLSVFLILLTVFLMVEKNIINRYRK